VLEDVQISHKITPANGNCRLIQLCTIRYHARISFCITAKVLT
jgi:hypothetical protein